jgi:hypothetical protein
MENPEKLATADTQDTGRIQRKQKHNTEKQTVEQHELPPKTWVEPLCFVVLLI